MNGAVDRDVRLLLDFDLQQRKIGDKLALARRHSTFGQRLDFDEEFWQQVSLGDNSTALGKQWQQLETIRENDSDIDYDHVDDEQLFMEGSVASMEKVSESEVSFENVGLGVVSAFETMPASANTSDVAGENVATGSSDDFLLSNGVLVLTHCGLEVVPLPPGESAFGVAGLGTKDERGFDSALVGDRDDEDQLRMGASVASMENVLEKVLENEVGFENVGIGADSARVTMKASANTSDIADTNDACMK
jgi:hypothetical protein